MSNRVLTWNYFDYAGSETRMGPTYYIEADYAPVAVRIHAEKAPIRDAKIDIFDDGVSIFNDRASKTFSAATGYSSNTPETEAVLGEGLNEEEYAEDFNGNPIEQGSWVHCTLVDAGGGKNFTVHLELEKVSEDDEPEE